MKCSQKTLLVSLVLLSMVTLLFYKSVFTPTSSHYFRQLSSTVTKSVYTNSSHLLDVHVNSSHLPDVLVNSSRLPVVHVNSSYSNTSTTALPLSSTSEYLQRVQFYQKQVNEFCADYGELGLLYSLPNEMNKGHDFYRHILRNRDSNILYCFVPKSGCTNLKALFYISQGLLPESILNHSQPKLNNQIDTVLYTYSFRGINTTMCKKSLKNSFKFAMWRNPLERLASSYRDKIQRFPLVTNSELITYIRRTIYSYMQQRQHDKWVKNGGKTGVPIDKAESTYNILFSDFIDYWLLGLQTEKDEHFQTFQHMCQPCRVHYDYYGNFNNFAEDAQVLINKLGEKTGYLRQGYYKDKSNSSHTMELHMYFHQLDYQRKKAVLHKLSKELDFYYRLFPEDRNSHKSILQIEDELPLTFQRKH